MPVFYFGKTEKVTCIVDVPQTAEGQELCLAHKHTLHWFGAGIYLSDDGYVLKPRGKEGIYYDLTEQAHEALPQPLPSYSIPFVEYAAGYSLWWILVLVGVWLFGVKVVRRYRQRKLDESMGRTPIDYGPPRLDTDGDRFIHETVKRQTFPGETIQHQAYAMSWDYNGDKVGNQAFFLVLTSARLFVWETRVGAFGILFETGAMRVVDRTEVTEARVANGNVLFVTTDDIQRGYVVRPQKVLSNQEAFLLHAGRLLSAPPVNAIDYRTPPAIAGVVPPKDAYDARIDAELEDLDDRA